jgi:hypothetical protein
MREGASTKQGRPGIPLNRGWAERCYEEPRQANAQARTQSRHAVACAEIPNRRNRVIPQGRAIRTERRPEPRSQPDRHPCPSWNRIEPPSIRRRTWSRDLREYPTRREISRRNRRFRCSSHGRKPRNAGRKVPGRSSRQTAMSPRKRGNSLNLDGDNGTSALTTHPSVKAGRRSRTRPVQPATDCLES